MKEIKTINKLNIELDAKPSKAHTLRALFLAALAKGRSIIKNPLIAEDQLYAIDALRNLGVNIEITKEGIIVDGVNGKFISKKQTLFIGNSGVSARFLTVLASLADKDIVIDGDQRMRNGRPIQDLLDSINPLGINAISINGNGCLPVLVKANSFKGGLTKLKGTKSSQFFSAIMISAPFAKQDVKILVEDKIVSKVYINITIKMMNDFSVNVINNNFNEFIIPSGQRFKKQEVTIEGDFSSAAFFFEAAAITKGRVRINKLNPDSEQGDKFFLDCLENMGCKINKGKDWIEVLGNELKSIKVDLCNSPDIVIPLAVVAAFAKGRSELNNIGHLKFKESNRLLSPVIELNKMGINSECTDNKIMVTGGKPHGAIIETHKDHRMVMGFAIAGLKVNDIKIKNPENVRKSFPDFFEILSKVIENENN